MTENITETQKRLQIALMLLDVPDHQAAIDQLDKILEKEPDNPTANLLLANTYIALYELTKAIPFLKKVVEAQPENREAQLSLGQALSWTGKHQEARPILEKLAEADPSNTDVLETLWDAYLGCGEIQLAEEIYQQIIQVAPDEIAIYEAMHHAYLESKHFDQAIQVAQYMAEKAPVATYLNILGETLLKAKNTDQAIAQFEKAIQNENDFEPAWTNLVEAYRQSNQIQKALQTADEGLNKCPGSLDIQEQKILAFIDLKQWKQSLELIEAVIDRKDMLSPASLDRFLMLKFFMVHNISGSQDACQMAIDLNRKYRPFLNEGYAHFYLLLYVLTETLRQQNLYQKVVDLLKRIPIQDLVKQSYLPRNYYLSLVGLNRIKEAGKFLQELTAHPEIDIDLKLKTLVLFEHSAQETLAADQPETLQTVLQQIRELNFLPEEARWQPPA
jgi:tetratricopeptide (TPR) repeat protein